MLKKLFFWTLFNCAMLHSDGQLLLLPEVQGGGIVMRHQLWSVVVNNLSMQTRKARLVVTVIDRNSSQTLLEANSGMLILPQGIKRYMYTDLSPLSYSIVAPDFGQESQSNKPLPVGEYIIVYRLIDLENKNDVITSETVNIVADPLSPPQLVFPEDQSMITGVRPVFTWTPPGPLSMFRNLGYTIVVVPFFENQSPQEAVQRNIPVLTTVASKNSMPYPSAYSDLQPGKTYVWQVAATEAGRFSGKSEVFSFTVMPDSIVNIINNAPYIRVIKDVPLMSVMHQGVLKIDFYNTTADSVVTIQVSRIIGDHKGKNNEFSFSAKVKPGQNYIEHRLKNKVRLDEEGVYEVRLLNAENEAWMMRFTPKYYF